MLELVLDETFLLDLLFSNHAFQLPFGNRLGSGVFAQVELEGLWNSDSITAFLAALL